MMNIKMMKIRFTSELQMWCQFHQQKRLFKSFYHVSTQPSTTLENFCSEWFSKVSRRFPCFHPDFYSPIHTKVPSVVAQPRFVEPISKRKVKKWTSMVIHQHPWDPPWSFPGKQNLPPFFLSGIRPLMGATKFCTWFESNFFFFFDTGLLFPRIRLLSKLF